MFDRKVLKTRAKLVLSNSYFMSFIACMIVAVISGGGIGLGTKRIQNLNFEAMSYLRMVAICAVAAMLIIITLLFVIFLISPLAVGLKKFMLGAATDGNISLNQLLFPFKNGYKNIVLTQFMRKLFVFLWSLPGFIPLAVGIWKFELIERIQKLAMMATNESVSAIVSLTLLMMLMLLLSLIFSIPSIIKDLQYSLTEYILAEEPDAPWRDVLARSKELMVGNKWAYIKLLFSFAGWYIAANLFCCIGNFLLNPYIEATFAQMYLELCGRGKNSETGSVFWNF